MSYAASVGSIPLLEWGFLNGFTTSLCTEIVNTAAFHGYIEVWSTYRFTIVHIKPSQNLLNVPPLTKIQ